MSEKKGSFIVFEGIDESGIKAKQRKSDNKRYCNI